MNIIQICLSNNWRAGSCYDNTLLSCEYRCLRLHIYAWKQQLLTQSRYRKISRILQTYINVRYFIFSHVPMFGISYTVMYQCSAFCVQSCTNVRHFVYSHVPMLGILYSQLPIFGILYTVMYQCSTFCIQSCSNVRHSVYSIVSMLGILHTVMYTVPIFGILYTAL